MGTVNSSVTLKFRGGWGVFCPYLTEVTKDRRRSAGVVPKRRCEITTTRCVISQKDAVLSYFTAEI